LIFELFELAIHRVVLAIQILMQLAELLVDLRTAQAP
jgi:hypothetical protein